MRYLAEALTFQSWQGLMSFKPDMIVSAGGSISAVNYFLAKEYQAKSVALMRPANISLKKFDLVIIPRHDRPQGYGPASSCRGRQPAPRKNVVITEGALNLVDAEYLSQKTKNLEQSGLLKGPLRNPCIGVLIGGNSKKFKLGCRIILELIGEIKKSAEELNADIFISTSRRSSSEVEGVIRSEFTNYARCKLLVIARENNHPDVVGGILGLSSLIVSSPESISMISEAVSAQKYVMVFNSGGLSAKHQRFLKNFSEQGYVYLEQVKDLSTGINQLLRNKPRINFPKDNLKAIEGLNKIL
jgi:hypothetical protein